MAEEEEDVAPGAAAARALGTAPYFCSVCEARVVVTVMVAVVEVKVVAVMLPLVVGCCGRGDTTTSSSNGVFGRRQRRWWWWWCGGGVRMRRTMSTSLPATPTTSLNISSSVKRSSWSFLGLATSTSKVFEQAGA